MSTKSPLWRHLRGRVASLSRDRSPNDPELLDAKRRLRALSLEEHVAAKVAEFPPLSDAQRARIATLLRGGAGDAR